MESLLGFPRRCHLASFAFLLALSLDFCEAFVKIHLHALTEQYGVTGTKVLFYTSGSNYRTN
jgi:hypothetical protein